jgi:hypothetical protein
VVSEGVEPGRGGEDGLTGCPSSSFLAVSNAFFVISRSRLSVKKPRSTNNSRQGRAG